MFEREQGTSETNTNEPASESQETGATSVVRRSLNILGGVMEKTLKHPNYSITLLFTLMSAVVARVAFYPSLLYNVVLEKLRIRNWYTHIDDTVILGALPFRSMTHQLVNVEHIKGVVTMNESYETRYFVNSSQEWASLGVDQLRLDTVDLVAAPSQHNLRQGVDFILDHRDRGQRVYVHCKAGRTRSATVVACYLMTLHGWTAEKAVKFLCDKRSQTAIRSPQWKALWEYQKHPLIRNTNV